MFSSIFLFCFGETYEIVSVLDVLFIPMNVACKYLNIINIISLVFFYFIVSNNIKVNKINKKIIHYSHTGIASQSLCVCFFLFSVPLPIKANPTNQNTQIFDAICVVVYLIISIYLSYFTFYICFVSN